jgi:hypothetical protein
MMISAMSDLLFDRGVVVPPAVARSSRSAKSKNRTFFEDRQLFPNRHAHHEQLEPDLLQSTAVVLTVTFNFSARFLEALRLHLSKSRYIIVLSAQGLIISRAF